jgi:hypothetical protein
MNIPELMKLVSDAYVEKDGEVTIPKFATQFTFAEHELFIRIPIYEFPPPRTLVGLICHVISTALPHLKTNRKFLEDGLQAAAVGKTTASNGRELIISGIGTSAGGSSHAIVTEINIRLRETQ